MMFINNPASSSSLLLSRRILLPIYNTGKIHNGKIVKLNNVNFQSMKSMATSAPMIETGCLTTSLATCVSAICAIRVWLNTV